ncbi:uncharacterized protein IL334_002816 [Kwoniella shivajii]|uniref:AB hydrolase-1 domain-containing protein n=1 Tax=Kwoniella shivajii TaxID=564305 RepID=A0ABZ1CW55_9TREE|nr:hypothetical protein IL334_002816 [Kwoniella shivajii]
MPRVKIADKPFELHYRLSSPSLRDEANEIDQDKETILFFHPYWTDSFYFYPQFEDPALYEKYNLIAFDAPAHGSTKVLGISSDPVTWAFFASMVKEALINLNVSSVHVIGSTMGCCPAVHFALNYPEMTDCAIMVAPPALQEAPNWSLTFRECMHILINAVRIRDPEPLDAITSVIFDYNATSHCGQAIKDLEEEYMQLIRSNLANGELNSDKTVPILISLALSRKQLLTVEEAVDLKPPVLIIQGTDEGWEEADDQWTKLLSEVNDAYREKHDKESEIKNVILTGMPRWMSLTCPDVLNPLITQFISSKAIHHIPPIPSLPTSGRRPSKSRGSSIGPQSEDKQFIDQIRKESTDVLASQHGREEIRHSGDHGVQIQVEVVMKVE